MANAAAPTPKENMGAPAPRYDARLKVTGEAHYPADTPVANPAYAALVTSAIARGRLETIDVGPARDVPGVVDVLTYQNTAELKPAKFGGGSSTSIQDLGPDIQHAGQIIAVVVADTLEAANEGASAVRARYVQQAPAATFGAAGLKVADATKESPQHKELPQAGDAEAAIAAADVVLDAEYGTPTQHHNPI